MYYYFSSNKDNHFILFILLLFSDNRNNKNQCKLNFRYLLLPLQVISKKKERKKVIGIYFIFHVLSDIVWQRSRFHLNKIWFFRLYCICNEYFVFWSNKGAFLYIKVKIVFLYYYLGLRLISRLWFIPRLQFDFLTLFQFLGLTIVTISLETFLRSFEFHISIYRVVLLPR